MLLFLLACASADAPADDSADTSATTMPKMTKADCALEDGEFLVYAGSDLPPAAVIYMGSVISDGGEFDGTMGWRVAESVSYRGGVFHIPPAGTECLAYIQ